MKTRGTSIALALLCLTTLGLSTAFAQEAEEAKAEEAPAGPSLRPIEILACSFHEGQTMDDLMEAAAGWNAWMDEQGQTGYWASLLIPNYYSAEITFDFAWVGGWQSGAEMAAGTEFWITKGGELQAAWDRVGACDQHINFAVYTVQPNPNPFMPGPVEFSNCTVEEGREMSDAIGAVHQWAAHEGDARGQFLLFPAFGESSDAEYSFKWVTVSSYEAFGAAYDAFGTGGGWQKYGELFKGLLDCDSSRVYHGTTIRKVDLGE